MSPSGNQRFGFVFVAVAAALGGCAGGGSAGTETDHSSSPGTDTGWQDGRTGLELPDVGGVETGWEKVSSDVIAWCAEPNGFGCPCTEHKDCTSGWCVFHLGEKVCSQTCVEDCPPGWVCEETSVGSDTVSVCKSPYPSLCLPCESSDGCLNVAGGGKCARYGEQVGTFCASPCARMDQCPEGYECRSAETIEGQSSNLCILAQGQCPCSSYASAQEMQTGCSMKNDWGTCLGWRVCGKAGLSECDAATPAEETCDGSDNDCDGFVDGPNLCDDGEECTKDECKGGVCAFVSSDEGAPCTADEDECTSDECQTGTCAHPPLSGIDCFDNDLCTTDDHCEAGVCLGVPKACPDDDDPCTEPVCSEGLCEQTPGNEGIPCEEDSNECTADICSLGLCVHPEEADGIVCTDDGDPCTVDLCSAGACAHPPGNDGASCDNDGDPCTADVCVAGQCAHPAGNDGATCDDADICTLGDNCASGKCIYVGFDDENPDCIPCGNCICQYLETYKNCPVDCGYCGDGICGCKEAGPKCGTCPKDCCYACGNGVCENGEDSSSCVADCGQCGDAVCSGMETGTTCPGDCPLTCGNGQCDGDESMATCSADCPPVCGDGLCLAWEYGCSEDCMDCGDGVCNSEELAAGDCPQDCNAACGNGVCEGGESNEECPVDCGFCGDGTCGLSESGESCNLDCGPQCGNGLCQAEESETLKTCPHDCDPTLADPDGDDVPSDADNCPLAWNPAQKDFDLDGLGDACDQDADGDGETGVSDCEPKDAQVSHLLAEVCDGKDNDCDGSVDEGFGSTTCGLGACLHTVENCFGGVSHVCDPMAGASAEVCDGKDNDCDGMIDEFFPDLDGDLLADCMDADIDGDGDPNELDCDSFDPGAHHGAQELCDGKDQDCDGATDGGFPDTDGDLVADCIDPDDDNDGTSDDLDCSPLNPSLPKCLGKECGDDACGGNCGDCGAGAWCDNGQCDSPAPLGDVFVDNTVLDPPDYNGCCGYLTVGATGGMPAFDLWFSHDLYAPGNDNCGDGPYTAESGKAIRYMTFHPVDITVKENHAAGLVNQVTLDWGENVAVDGFVPGNAGWKVQILMQDGSAYEGYFVGVWCRACLYTWDHQGSFKITQKTPPPAGK